MDFLTTPLPQSVPAFTAWDVHAPVIVSSWLNDTCAVALGDGSVRLLRTGLNTPVAVAANPSGGAVLALVACERFWLAGSDDGSLTRIFPTGQTEAFGKVPGFAEHLAWDELTGIVAVASGKRVHLFKPDGTAAREALVFPSSVGGLAVSPIAARLAVAHYGGVQVVALDNLKAAPRQLVWQGSHLSLTYSPDGKWLISALQENAIHLWRLADGLDLHMRGYLAKPLGFSWSHDGTTLATTGGAGVPLWSFKNPQQGPAGQQATVLASSGSPEVLVSAVALHPNGPFAAVGYTDGLVLLVNTTDQRSILLQAPLENPSAPPAITTLGWQENGLALVAGSHAGRLLHTNFTALLNPAG